MKRILLIGVVALLSVSLLASCSSKDNDDEKKEKSETSTTIRNDESKGTEIATSLKEFKIVTDPTTASAGDVTFAITNDGLVTHEFVVFKTDLDNRDLPVDDEGQVDEEGDGVTFVDEIEDIEKGSTQNLAVDLSAGKYVVFCNIEGHYASGMSAAFTVS